METINDARIAPLPTHARKVDLESDLPEQAIQYEKPDQWK